MECAQVNEEERDRVTTDDRRGETSIYTGILHSVVSHWHSSPHTRAHSAWVIFTYRNKTRAREWEKDKKGTDKQSAHLASFFMRFLSVFFSYLNS